MAQQTLMQFDPATGELRPYPSHAEQWRAFHGPATAWLFNPWTGTRRDAGDVGGLEAAGWQRVVEEDRDQPHVVAGGFDPVKQRPFTYYETLAGGAGGGRSSHEVRGCTSSN